MSATDLPDAAYRVEISFDPHNETWPWVARIFSPPESTEAAYSYQRTEQGSSYDEALERARTWIIQEHAAKVDPVTRYFDERGRDAAAPVIGPHSVKV